MFVLLQPVIFKVRYNFDIFVDISYVIYKFYRVYLKSKVKEIYPQVKAVFCFYYLQSQIIKTKLNQKQRAQVYLCQR